MRKPRPRRSAMEADVVSKRRRVTQRSAPRAAPGLTWKPAVIRCTSWMPKASHVRRMALTLWRRRTLSATATTDPRRRASAASTRDIRSGFMEAKQLTGKQKRHLRGLGHALSPVVMVGKEGSTDAVARKAREEI